MNRIICINITHYNLCYPLSNETLKETYVVFSISQMIHFRVCQSLGVLHVTKCVYLTQNIGMTKNIAVA